MGSVLSMSCLFSKTFYVGSQVNPPAMRSITVAEPDMLNVGEIVGICTVLNMSCLLL